MGARDANRRPGYLRLHVTPVPPKPTPYSLEHWARAARESLERSQARRRRGRNRGVLALAIFLLAAGAALVALSLLWMVKSWA